MNKNILKGNWEQLKGEARKQWGKLTDDELDEVAGDAQKLRGLIQERYGKSQDEARKEVEEWSNTIAR